MDKYKDVNVIPAVEIVKPEVQPQEEYYDVNDAIQEENDFLDNLDYESKYT